jgi:hypothetical protein
MVKAETAIGYIIALAALVITALIVVGILAAR